ncbi:MAG: BON domain-containing protein [Burkholderiales bacterium]|nr:BON domain-containing protein [Burkholderiales bacterium]
MPYPAPLRIAAASAALAACALLAACSGGTPWGATPQNLPVTLPDLRHAGQVVDGASGSTAGALRVAERVQQALAADPQLAGQGLTVEGLEGGLIVLGGPVRSTGDRQRALDTARRVPGVSQVVDRMRTP